MGGHIGSSHFSALGGNHGFKQSSNFRTPAQFSSFRPGNNKLGISQKTNKPVNLGKGNQFSKGRNNFASNNPNFKNQKNWKNNKPFHRRGWWGGGGLG